MDIIVTIRDGVLHAVSESSNDGTVYFNDSMTKGDILEVKSSLYILGYDIQPITNFEVLQGLEPIDVSHLTPINLES